MKEISITACGVATPYGVGTETLWNTLIHSNSLEESNEIDIEAPSFDCVSPRLKRKMDRFTTLAYPPFQEIIDQLDLKRDELAHKGIILGNSCGGWSYVEPQMDPLYNESFHTLSPYVATAWFPTAIQGQISISFGIGGYSKTIAADNLSAAYSLMHAIDLMECGEMESCFVGGVESPNSSLVKNDMEQREGRQRLSEGAALLHLEKGKKGVAQIIGMTQGASPEEAFKALFQEFPIDGREIDIALLDDEESEVQSLQQLGVVSPMGNTKKVFGNSIASDYALKLVLATLILKHKTYPKILFSQKESPLKKEPKLILVGGGDLHGQYIATLLQTT